MRNRGWTVTFSGMGLNLALGVLYAWSVFGKQLTEATERGGLGWTKLESALPYTLAIATFALVMIPAGRLQDRLGPRLVATIGALLAGAGLVVASFVGPDSMTPALLGFGIIAGSGFGLGYAAATPAAVKWFPPEKKGLITGIVVSGFGLAPVYIAPLSRYLLEHFGLGGAFRILGIGFALVTTVLCQFIVNPPPQAAPAGGSTARGEGAREMLRTPQFYMLYVEFACAAMAGLMIIGHLSKIVSVQSGNTISIGFIFVALLAIFNALGRIVAGTVSDRIGRAATIATVCALQCLTMLLFGHLSTAGGFFVGAAAVGFCYGACLALFPSTCADYWGTKNLGLNYGILFTAWGVGGVFGPVLAGRIADATGSYTLAYAYAAGLLALAVAMTFLRRRVMMPRKAFTTT